MKTIEIYEAFPGQVSTIKSTKTEMYGERATSIVVGLEDGRTVTGTFTTEAKDGFGGVDFSQKKDPVALMIAKVKSVLEGKHDARV